MHALKHWDIHIRALLLSRSWLIATEHDQQEGEKENTDCPGEASSGRGQCKEPSVVLGLGFVPNLLFCDMGCMPVKGPGFENKIGLIKTNQNILAKVIIWMQSKI